MHDNGNPEAIPLLNTKISGTTSKCSTAKNFPVLPNPV
jgi:hypothetical protein